ncbi:MAG: YIP1 family protein [Nanoarchaeota archaeon]|nr:YIP1 family protein [Nanoarchaeota archaeon]
MNSEILLAVRVAKLDTAAIRQISKEQKALKSGLLIAAIGGAVNGLWGLFKGTETAASLVFSILSAIVSVVFFALLIHGTAKLFRGKGTLKEMMRPIFYASILTWLSPLESIPLFGKAIGIILGVWMLVVLVFVTKEAEQFGAVKAAVAVILPIAILTLILITLETLANLTWY